MQHAFLTIRQTGNLWEISFQKDLPPTDFENLKAAVKAIGADWDQTRRVWVVSEVRRADALAYANATAKTSADLLARINQFRLQFSGATTMAVDQILAPAGLSLMAHQTEGVQWIAGRSGSLLAFDMGTGKGQPVDGEVLTPSGFRRVGDLGVGDEVIGSDGMATAVVGVFPRGQQNIYRVSFSDGASILVDGDHLWKVKSANHRYRGESGEVVGTLELMERLKSGPRYACYSIPTVEPVGFDCIKHPLPIDPWLLGLLIGDGSFRGSVSFTSADFEIVDRVSWQIGHDFPECAVKRKSKYDYRISRRKRGGKNGLLDAVRSLCLAGHKSESKFIPDRYLLAGRNVRGELLRGLMDSDGHAGRTSLEYSTSSPQLAKDFIFLVRSLGGLATVVRKKTKCLDSYRITPKFPSGFEPFWLKRKLEAYKRPSKYPLIRLIRSIEPAGVADTVCIKVAAEDQLYVASDFIVTHNTPTAIACLNASPDFKRSLIICPASLKRNWYAEAKRWMVDQSRTVGIAQGSYLPPTDVVIMNYDILDRHKPALDAVPWDFIFIDEAHYLKSPKAKRTKCVIGGKTGKNGIPLKPLHGRRKVCLTGTPVVNTPADLWTICNWLDPKNWPNLYWFESRYCKFETKYFGRGKARVYSGAKNLDELNARLKGTIMLRKTKAQVLPDLPPKFRQVIEVDVVDKPGQSIAGLLREESNLLSSMKQRISQLQAAIQLARVSGDESGYRSAINALADYYKGPEGEHVAIVRQKIAMAKLPYVIDDIRNSLLDPSVKVLVGAHHRAILEAIRDQLTLAGVGCVLLYGGMSDDEKDQAVKGFQNDPATRVFIGGFRAAGVGLNLTAASQVVFAEEDYVPSTITQFEDRAHRKGQLSSVLVKHIVAHGSLDSRIAKLAIAKQEVADRSVDGSVAAEEPVDWLGDHRSAPTDEELETTVSGNDVAASTYGLRRLVTNPKEYGVSDQDLIIAERLSNRELVGRPAALARWLMKKYLDRG